MQIDNNIINVMFALTAATFAFLYFRSYLNTRFMQMQRSIDDHATDLYRETENVNRRVFALEKCCEKNACSKDKNFYNTGA